MINRLPDFFTILTTAVAIAISVASPHQTIAEPGSEPVQKRLSTLQFEHEVFTAELEKPIQALAKRYVELLAKEEARLTKSDNPEAAKIIREEIDSHMESDVEIPESLAEARRLQGIFQRERLRLARQREVAVVKLLTSYRQKLEALRQNSRGAAVEAIDIEWNATNAALLAKQESMTSTPGMSGTLAAKPAGGDQR